MFPGRSAATAKQPRTPISLPFVARQLQQPINLLLLRLDDQEDRLTRCEKLLRAIAAEMGLNADEVLK